MCRNQALPPNAQMHLHAVLDGVVANASYPAESDNEGSDRTGAFSSEADASAGKEEQSDIEEKRKDLFVLMKNVAKLSFAEALGYVGRLLQGVLGRANARFQVPCRYLLVIHS